MTAKLSHAPGTLGLDQDTRSMEARVIEIECPWCERQLRVEMAQLEAEVRCEDCAIAWSVADATEDALAAAA